MREREEQRASDRGREGQRGPILANVRWGNGGHRRVRTIRLAAGADTSPCLKPPLRRVSIYIHSVYIWSPWQRSVYGPTDGYSARAHPPPLAHRGTLRETNVRASPTSTTVDPYASSRIPRVCLPMCVCVRAMHGESARAHQYQRTGPPVHQGTKPKAINLFARQPATRHCVYPHVNHYVRLRDIEPDTRPVSQRISNSPFPAVGQNA